MHKIYIFLILLITVPLLQAQNVQESKPPLHAGKIAIETTAAFGGGMVLGAAGALVGIKLNNGGGWDDLAGALLGIIVGYPIGTAAGASLVGNYGNERGSFWAALGGSAAGLISGLLFNSLFKNTDALPYFIGILPPAGAVLGHNLTRSYDHPVAGSALLNYQNGVIFAAAPAINLKSIPGYQKSVLQMHIFDIRF